MYLVVPYQGHSVTAASSMHIVFTRIVHEENKRKKEKHVWLVVVVCKTRENIPKNLEVIELSLDVDGMIYN